MSHDQANVFDSNDCVMTFLHAIIHFLIIYLPIYATYGFSICHCFKLMWLYTLLAIPCEQPAIYTFLASTDDCIIITAYIFF